MINRIRFTNSSPNNTWVLSGAYPNNDSEAFCEYDSCALVLAPDAEQAIVFANNNASIVLAYYVCDTTGFAAVIYGRGLPKCAVYSGAKMNVTATPMGLTVVAMTDSIQTIAVEEMPLSYFVEVTTTPPPTCYFPHPTVYIDGKRRIINLAGAEFETPEFPYLCDAAYFVSVGVNTIRVLFNWQYLQISPGRVGTIDWMSGGYANQLMTLVNAWTEAKLDVMIAMNDAMFLGHCITGAPDCWVSRQLYANTWSDIAEKFMDNARVIFGLMNAPYVNDGTTLLLNNQNAAAMAIREVGSMSLILYSGNGYSAMTNWSSSSYGMPNQDIFIPQNITDNHYQIAVNQFSSQQPENFLYYMNQTGIPVMIDATGGTDSAESVACIRSGTQWLFSQQNITGIALWAAGHAWLQANDSTYYPMYLGEVQGMPVTQMTAGFQQVTHTTTGAFFLIPPKTLTHLRNDNNASNDLQLWAYALSLPIAGLLLYIILSIKENWEARKKASIFAVRQGNYRHTFFTATTLQEPLNSIEMTALNH